MIFLLAGDPQEECTSCGKMYLCNGSPSLCPNCRTQINPPHRDSADDSSGNHTEDSNGTQEQTNNYLCCINKCFFLFILPPVVNCYILNIALSFKKSIINRPKFTKFDNNHHFGQEIIAKTLRFHFQPSDDLIYLKIIDLNIIFVFYNTVLDVE